MFFRLTAVDDLQLPCPIVIDGHEYIVVHGGLLLEPPSSSGVDGGESEGHSVLKFFGNPSPAGIDGLLAASREPYRFDPSGQLLISRRDRKANLEARFSGTVEGMWAELSAEPGSRFLRGGTRLTLQAAPEEPITRAWAATFDFGPPWIHLREPRHQDDPVVLAEIQRFLAAGEPARIQAATERLERAWRAPPNVRCS